MKKKLDVNFLVDKKMSPQKSTRKGDNVIVLTPKRQRWIFLRPFPMELNHRHLHFFIMRYFPSTLRVHQQLMLFRDNKPCFASPKFIIQYQHPLRAPKQVMHKVSYILSHTHEVMQSIILPLAVIYSIIISVTYCLILYFL